MSYMAYHEQKQAHTEVAQGLVDGLNAEPIPEIVNAVREVARKATENVSKIYTVEELAELICGSYEECTEGECPGFAYCKHDKKGVLVWLQSIVERGGNNG